MSFPTQTYESCTTGLGEECLTCSILLPRVYPLVARSRCLLVTVAVTIVVFYISYDRNDSLYFFSDLKT